ncbi:MAG: cation transporting ATPase C-terminal domain-containing protein, partial [Bdellovibrionales bacterium]|nr:cation transporting ATPase C-terminal domain-containing protein [Bdellovibrionales bacterium]
LARNLVFTTIVFSQLLRAFGARSNTKTFWKLGVFSNLWLLGVVIVTVLTQISLHYIPLTQSVFKLSPLSLSDLALIWPVALIPVTAIELRKWIMGILKSKKQ